MKTMKRCISFLLALVMVAGMLPHITLQTSAISYTGKTDVGAEIIAYFIKCPKHPYENTVVESITFKGIKNEVIMGGPIGYSELSVVTVTLDYTIECYYGHTATGTEDFYTTEKNLCSKSSDYMTPIELYGKSNSNNYIGIVKSSADRYPTSRDSHFMALRSVGDGWHEYYCMLCESDAVRRNEVCSENTSEHICKHCRAPYEKAKTPGGVDVSTNDVSYKCGSTVQFTSLACPTHPNASNEIISIDNFRSAREVIGSNNAVVSKFYVDYKVDCTKCGKVVSGSEVFATHQIGLCYEAYNQNQKLQVAGEKYENSRMVIVESSAGDNWSSNHFGVHKNSGEGKHNRSCGLCGKTEGSSACTGTATCVERATCNDCGVPFGSVDPNNHAATGEAISENGTHYYVCANGCGQRANETACSGGTATCTERAVCDTCGGEYGSLDSSNHAPAASWSAANGKHYKVCENGCGTKLEVTACSGGTATCVKVANCATCNQAYGSVDPDNHKAASAWTTENGKHYKLCAYGCGAKLEEAQCSGGTATCYDKAKCDTCGVEYGEPAGHTGGVATCLEKGVCTRCGEEYLGIDSKNHASSETYEVYYSVMEHRVYHSCCDRLIGYYSHSPAEGQEATCQSLAVCADCGESYGYMDYTNHTSDELTYRFSLKYDNVVNSPWDYDEHRVYHACCGTRAGNEAHTPGELIWVGTEKVSQYCTTCQGKIGEALIHINGMETDENGMEANSAVYNGEQFFALVDSLGVMAPNGTDDQWDITVTLNGEEVDLSPVHPGTYTVTCTRDSLTLTKDFTIEMRPLHIVDVLLGEVDEETGVAQLVTVLFDKLKNDDVYVPLDSGLTCTLEGTTPGQEYTEIYGLNLTEDMILGEDKENYVFISDPDGNYTVNSYFVDRITLYISADYQYGEEMDYGAYTVEGLRKGHTISGITLELDEYDNTIYVNIDNLVILDANGNDVTSMYSYSDTVTSGKFYKTHADHEFNTDGFCATGECEAFKAPGVLHDEWGDVVYQIANAGQLYWFADRVNTVDNYAKAVLTADIVVPENAPNWVPIGGYNAWSPYTGAFDGQNHTISGLRCVSEGNYAGLFGYTDYNNQIKNIGIIDGHFESAKYAGGLIGCGYTTVSNCFVLDTTVKSDSYEVAQIIGYNGGELYNSFTNGEKVCGAGYGTFENCYYQSKEETEDGGRTAEQFAIGQVAYELQAGVPGEDIYDDDWNWVDTITPHVWGQTIGTDAYPTLGGKKVYVGYGSCADYEKGYTNISATMAEKPEHSMGTDSICDICGSECTHDTFTDGKCALCGHVCDHTVFANGTCLCGEIVGGYCGAEEDGKNLTWTFVDGTLTIKGEGAMRGYSASDKAPWRSFVSQLKSIVIEDGVTAIGQYAFYQCLYVENAEIADSVESIGKAAFEWCHHLRGVVIPEKVTVIPEDAFADCQYLKFVTMEGDVTIIGNRAFENCFPFTEINLPDSVVTIGERAFVRSGVRNLVIPDSVTSIGNQAFRFCTNLESVTIGKGVTNIGEKVFDECWGLRTLIWFADGDVTFGENVFYSNDCTDKVDLLLASGCADQVTDEVNWRGYRFKSIQILCADGTLDHTYEYTDNGDGTHALTCSVCGYVTDEVHSHDDETCLCICGNALLCITQEPESVKGKVGETAVFTVAAEGRELTYQWYYYNAAQGEWLKSYSPGYNSDTLSVTVYAYRDGQQYRCVITDAYGNSVTSQTAVMTLDVDDLGIASISGDVVGGAIGKTYTFSVDATGDNLTYLWQVSTDDGETWAQTWLSGYNTDTLTVKFNANRDGNLYRCIVSCGGKESITSEPMGLYLQEASVEIQGISDNVKASIGENATFTVTAAGIDLSYAWYRSYDNGATWEMTYLPGYNTDTLSFEVNANRTGLFLCKVTDGSGKTVCSDVVRLTLCAQIVTMPESVDCAIGDTATFTVAATGENLRYQWYYSADGGETWVMSYLTGYNTETLSFYVNASRASRIYKCVITDRDGATLETDAVSVNLD